MKKTAVQITTVTKTELVPYSEYERYLKKIWKTHWVTNNGQFLLELEKKLQKIYNTKNLLVVSNGTLAMQLALKALPKRSGQIITTPFTFQATTNVIAWEGYTPVFADIDAETLNINPDDVESLITTETVAILAVHVYGNACDIERLEYIAKKHNITLIYDAAHAFDVIYKGKQLATYGDISTLSFHATKTFHTIEGGAIISRDPKFIEQWKLLRNFGIQSEEQVISCGINTKMNEFQAAMGLANLKHVAKRFRARKSVHDAYMEALRTIPNIRLQKIVVEKENYSYLPILLPSKKVRDALYEKMKHYNIGTRKYFYPLTSTAKYLREMPYNISASRPTPVAADVADRVLCLPMYASLPLSKVKQIIKIMKVFLRI